MFCVETHGPLLTRSAEKCFSEIDFLYKEYGVRLFGFGDPNVNGDHRGFKRLCDLLIAAALDCTFWCELNAKNTSKGLLLKMKKAGFRGIQIGVESFSSQLLRKMNKPSRLIDNIKVLKWSREVGLDSIYYNLICNFPGESEYDLRQMIELLPTILPLVSRPFRIAVAEFEFHRSAPIFEVIRDNGTYSYSDFEFFRSWAPAKLKVPFHRLKIGSRMVNPLWQRIVELINDAHSRDCGLYYTDAGDLIHTLDLRESNPTMSQLGGCLREVFMVIADADDLISTNTLLKKLCPRFPSENVTASLSELAKARFIYSEENNHISLATFVQSDILERKFRANPCYQV